MVIFQEKYCQSCATAQLNKNKSKDRTGGHITGVNSLYGVFLFDKEPAIRMLESSFPRGGDSYRIYKKHVLDVCFNVCTVFRVNDQFVSKASKAKNVKEMTEILEDLKAQVENKKVLPTSVAYPALASKVITKGDSGQSVVELQTYLESLGLFNYNGPKGYFGNITRIALGNWQIKYLGRVYGTSTVWGPISQKKYLELHT